MANTRARSFNTLTYNGGKHMLNSKIAMKKRLLHKYKLEPVNPSSGTTFLHDRFSQQKSPIKTSANEESCDEEPIDVETVSSSHTPDVDTINDEGADCEARRDSDEQVTPAQKPSLEQVVARCRLKSCETAAEVSEQDKSPKSAIESLKDVVNNVSSSADQTMLDDSEHSVNSSGEMGSHCSQGIKRYLSPQAKSILSEWFRKHLYRPYPTFEEKRELAARCGISSSKVDTWFANKRNRTHNTKKFPSKYSHIF